MQKKNSMRWLSIYELMILMVNVARANETEGVGFEDARYTADGFLRKLNKRFQIKKADLESALYACNLLDEKGLFWHPRKISLKEFMGRLLQGEKFNVVYNFIEDDEDDE